MKETATSVTRLLRVEQLKEERRPSTPRLFAFAFGLANLFFMAYFERFLAEDRSGRSLQLLLFIQAWVFLALSATHFQDSTADTLNKAVIFPSSSWDRFVFTCLSNLRRPIIVLWWGGTVLAFLVLLHQNVGELILPAILFSLLVLFLQSMLSSLLLFARRMDASVSAMLWTFAAFLFILTLISLILRTQELISLILPVRWAAAAIAGLRENSYLPVVWGGGLILGSVVLMMVFSRKYC
jgi:hypothetical protein